MYIKNHKRKFKNKSNSSAEYTVPGLFERRICNFHYILLMCCCKATVVLENME